MGNELKDVKLSPHTLQNKNASYYEGEFFRTLKDSFPRKKYCSRAKDEDRTTVHFGQRKLFLSEVEFLTLCCNSFDENTQNPLVIYAGAAPGTHISLLSKMFPFIKFVLIDPAFFIVKENERIEIIQDFFTDALAEKFAEKYKDHTILFISDIRVFGPGSINEDSLEDKVNEDMAAQMRWYYILNPFKSMLKFRPPYIGEKTYRKTAIEYLEGEIYLQIWPAGSSSETRLIVDQNAGKKSYDCVKYEDQLYRFNQVERTLCYWHEIKCAGIDHCYDCRAEILVFEEYLRSFDKVKELTEKCGYEINSMSVVEYVELLNDHLNASMKKIRFVIDKKNYDIKFTDVRFGIKQSELFDDSSLVFTRRKTYLDNKFIPYAQIKRPLNHNAAIKNDIDRDSIVDTNRDSKRTRFNDNVDDVESFHKRRRIDQRSNVQETMFNGNYKVNDPRGGFDYSRLRHTTDTDNKDRTNSSYDKDHGSVGQSCDFDELRRPSSDEPKIDNSSKKRKYQKISI
jgi:hypothetical protein